MKKRFVVIALCIGMSILSIANCDVGPTQGAFLEAEASLCVGCGRCVTVCKYDAITVMGNKAVIDPQKCQQCLKCIKACPYDAIH